MLCRAVLTAIAISCTFSRETLHARGQGSPRIVQIKDVICVLLLSGLQKEELDANTMEKLRRHNVNIYDMNNESLRQECLLKSLGADKEKEGFETPEDKNVTLTNPLNRLTENEGYNTEKPKTETTTSQNYLVNKEDLRTLIEEIKTKDTVNNEPNRNDNMKASNVANAQDDINVTKVDENTEPRAEYVKSQASLDSVLKFWSQFARKKSTETVTEITTTYNPPETQSTINSDNKGYVHSREIEYVNRIISEYMASQTVPTTTQVAKKKKQNTDIISRKIKELLAKKEKDDEIDSITALRNMGEALNVKIFGDFGDFGGAIRINNKDSSGTKKALHVTPGIVFDNRDPPKRLEETAYDPTVTTSPTIVTTVKSLPPKMEALKYLDAFLRLNRESNVNNEPITSTERSTHNPTINTEKQLPNDSWDKNVRYDTRDANNTNKDLSQAQNKGISDVPIDVIQKIAEKVKEIVMKDMKKDTTDVPTTITTISTSASTVTITTEIPTMSLNDTNDKQVLQQLMDFFKGYKQFRQATNAPPPKVTKKPDTTTIQAPSVNRMVPPIMSGFNPYEMKPQAANVKEMNMNPFKQSFVQIPLGPADRALQALPYNVQTNSNQKPEYQILPITIQTNSVEVPPLAIPLSKPLPIINQHIIVTTPNPFERHKSEQPKHESKQTSNNKYREVLGVGSERNHRVEKPTYVDLAKKLQTAENIKKDFRDTYKDRIQKLKERIKYAHEHNREKARELNHALGSDYQIGSSRLVAPSYRGGFDPNVGSSRQARLNQPMNSNRHDVFSRPFESSHHETFNRYLDPSFYDTLGRSLDLNQHDSVNRPSSSNLHENLNRPINAHPYGGSHHQGFNRPLEPSPHESLNRPLDLNQYVSLNRPDDPNQRDIITREVLSRLVGSNHHDVISRLVEPNPIDIINRPVDLNQQSRSHHSDAYERIEHERMHPRYKGARFHEELERIEAMPKNDYGAYNKATQSCCDSVAARQQRPLTNITQRAKFDDTHFRNFLKSQQKVTDMLERILASKSKQDRPESVEIT